MNKLRLTPGELGEQAGKKEARLRKLLDNGIATGIIKWSPKSHAIIVAETA